MEKVSTTHKRVLIADDQEAIRDMLKIALEHSGYEVVIAKNGEEAVALAKKEKPDLLMLDVMMPEMDGYSALLQIRGEIGFEKIPALFITAKTETVYKAISEKVGAIYHMTKPISLSELKIKLKEIFENL